MTDTECIDWLERQKGRRPSIEVADSGSWGVYLDIAGHGFDVAGTGPTLREAIDCARAAERSGMSTAEVG